MADRERPQSGADLRAWAPNGSRDGRLAIQAPPRPLWRYRAARLAARIGTCLFFRIRTEGLDRLPPGPSILCFNHQNWSDPIFVLRALPLRPRTSFFGPQEEDMTRGFRNRVMRWIGIVVPFRRGRRGLAAAMRRVEDLFTAGERLAIFGEGRIHSGEAVLLPLEDGPAYMALRYGVPIVPAAINGTSWLVLGRRLRIRFGQPLDPAGMSGLDQAEAVARLTGATHDALLELIRDFPDPPPSRWIGRRITELFNDWPEGSRPPVPPRITPG